MPLLSGSGRWTELLIRAHVFLLRASAPINTALSSSLWIAAGSQIPGTKTQHEAVKRPSDTSEMLVLPAAVWSFLVTDFPASSSTHDQNICILS